MNSKLTYNLTDKIIIITGANSGIGKAASVQLAQMGATVVLACRSLERGTKALEEIKRLSASNKVALLCVDMASQKSVRQFVVDFSKQYNRLDVLINNAANFDHSIKTPQLTEDGIETVFATNHVNVFMLTHLLMDKLKASAPSRIINVASQGLSVYPTLDIQFDNLNGEKKFSMQHAYYQSKQAQVMFTFYLAERLRASGVTVNCVRVGNVAIPDERLTHLSPLLRKLYSVKRKFSVTPEEMAETYTWLAADPSLETTTGGYWDAPMKPVKANKNAYNHGTQKRLWDVTEQMVN